MYYCFNSIKIYGLEIYSIPIIFLSLLSIVNIIKIRDKKYDIKYFLWYFSFFSFGCLSLIWTINVNISLVVLKRVFISLLFLFNLIVYTEKSKKLKKVIKLNVFALVIMTIILILKESGKTYFYGDVIGFYRNSIAISLLFGIIQLYYIYCIEKRKNIILLIFLFLYVIYKTGSRKSIIFVILFFIIELFIKKSENLKDFVKKIFILLIILLGIIYVIQTNSILSERIFELFKSFKGESVNDLSIIERKYYRNLALQLFKNKPIFGYGIFGFAAYLQNIGYWHVAYCHCNWLELLSTLGIVGFFIYYYQYFKILLKSFKIFDSKKCQTTIPLIAIILLFLMEYGFVSYYSIPAVLILFVLYKILMMEGTDKNDI